MLLKIIKIVAFLTLFVICLFITIINIQNEHYDRLFVNIIAVIFSGFSVVSDTVDIIRFAMSSSKDSITICKNKRRYERDKQLLEPTLTLNDLQESQADEIAKDEASHQEKEQL